MLNRKQDAHRFWLIDSISAPQNGSRHFAHWMFNVEFVLDGRNASFYVHDIIRTEKQVINISVIFTHRFCDLVHFNGLLYMAIYIMGISLFTWCKQNFHLDLQINNDPWCMWSQCKMELKYDAIFNFMNLWKLFSLLDFHLNGTFTFGIFYDFWHLWKHYLYIYLYIVVTYIESQVAFIPTEKK